MTVEEKVEFCNTAIAHLSSLHVSGLILPHKIDSEKNASQVRSELHQRSGSSSQLAIRNDFQNVFSFVEFLSDIEKQWKVSGDMAFERRKSLLTGQW